MGVGDLIGFMLMIGIVVFGFVIFSSTLDEVIANCSETNITLVGCELFEEDSPFASILNNKILLFLLFIIPMFMVFKIIFRNPFRRLLYGIGDIFESFESSSNNNDNKKEKHLKKMKSKLKKDLNSYNDSRQTIPTNKGVEWGTGVESGKGMDDYETKLKGGDKKDG